MTEAGSKKLLSGRIVFRQREDGAYEFSGQGLARLDYRGVGVYKGDDGSNELRRVVTHSFVFEIRALAIAV
jgi:hypothetical protein